MDKIKVGFIGCGYWGLNHIRVFNELPKSIAYTCSDLDYNKLNRIKSIYPNIKITKRYRDVLNDPKVDAVCVSTPASTHYRLAKESLKSGKHVLVEKPFTLRVREALELIDLAKQNKDVLMVGHVFRYHCAVQKLQEYIETGELGDVIYLYSSRTGLGPVREDVNAMWDLAPHDLSIIMYLLGMDPLDVSARGEAYLHSNIADVVFMTLRFPKHIFACIHTSWLDPCKIRKTTIIGSKKMAVFDDTENMEKLRLYDRGFSPKSYTSFGEFQLVLRDGDIIIPKIEMEEPLKIECRHFLECINEGKKPVTNGEEGLRIVKVLEKAEESLKNNGTVVTIS